MTSRFDNAIAGLLLGPKTDAEVRESIEKYGQIFEISEEELLKPESSESAPNDLEPSGLGGLHGWGDGID
jgi:hypothetical protein